MSKKRTAGVRKCLSRFTLVADEVEAILSGLPAIARVSVKDMARVIAAKQKLDYTGTHNIVTTYVRMRAADGRLIVNRGGAGGVQVTGK